MGLVKTLLHSNEAIGKVLRDTATWRTGVDRLQLNNVRNKAIRYAGLGAAGYAGLDVAGRFATGDSLFYKDTTKKFDVAGIPFI